MTGICDMHSHILPGLDDGSKSMEETMQVLHEAVKQQIAYMIVTPHFYPGKYVPSASQILESLAGVQEQCIAQRLNITLYPGQECFYYSKLTHHLDIGNALTLANSRYVLIEFEPDSPFTYIVNGLRDLQNHGYRPILAHFERYICLREEEKLKKLKEQGILLQMNFDMLILKDGIFHRNPWRKLLKAGYVDFLGSDCHGMDFRPLHVKEACQWLEAHLDEQSRIQLLETNIQKIIWNE